MGRKRLQRLDTPPGQQWNRITALTGDVSRVEVGVYDADGKLLRTVPHRQGVLDEPLVLEAGETVYVAVDVA